MYFQAIHERLNKKQSHLFGWLWRDDPEIKQVAVSYF